MSSLIRGADTAEKAFHGCPVDYQKLWRSLTFPVVIDGDYDGKECHFGTNSWSRRAAEKWISEDISTNVY